MTDITELGIKIRSDGTVEAARELDKLSDAGDKAEKSTKELGQQSHRTQGALKELGLQSKLTYAAIAAGAATILKKVIDQHIDFTAKVSELSAITGATGKDLQFYAAQARLIGETTTLSASQAAEAFKLMASAKPDLLASKDALAAVTKEAVTLAEASGMTLPDAAKALGGAMNQFRVDASKAGEFINVLAAGAKFGASEINDTAEALKNAGTVAKNAGLSFEETNAAIQAMAAVSIKGGEAGTGLRNILLRLSTQAEDKFNPEIVGLSRALHNLRDAHLTTAEKAKLFGQESIAAANAVIDQADAVDDLTNKLTGTKTATEQAAVRNDNLAGDLKKLSSAWSEVALTIGEEFDPALREIAQLMTEVTHIVTRGIKEFTDLGDLLGAWAAWTVQTVQGNEEAAKAIIKAREAERAELEKSFTLSEKTTRQLEKQAEAHNVVAEAAAKPTTQRKKNTETISLSDTVEGWEKYETQLAKVRAEQEKAAQALHDSTVTELDKLREAGKTKLDIEAENHKARMDFLNSAGDEFFNNTAERNLLLEQENQRHEDSITAIAKEGHDKRKQQDEDYRRTRQMVMSGMFGNLSALMESGSRKVFEIGKAAAIANAVVSGREAAISSYAAGAKIGGPPLGYAFELTSILATAAMINKLRSTSFGGGGTASASGSASVPSAAPVSRAESAQQATTNNATNLNVNIHGTVLGANVEDIVVNSLKRVYDKDGAHITIAGQRAEFNIA